MAAADDRDAFTALVERHRRELHVHCYRMLGSIQDAEDVVQETFAAAWRGFGAFEGRSSVRTWLYRIATNRCLNALRDNKHRPIPVFPPGLAPPAATRTGETLFLEPFPDALLDDPADGEPGPEARYERHEAVSLAFVTALQTMPPRQRAVLVLRDVLGFRAAEVAGMLDVTVDTVTSALKRARAGVPEIDRDRAPLPGSARERAVAGRFAEAVEAGDVDAMVALLTDDAWMTMPPVPLQYQGRDLIADFMARIGFRGGTRRMRLVPVRANGQAAFGCYIQDAGEVGWRPHGLMVLDLVGDRISMVTRFVDTAPMPHFGLPARLDPVTQPRGGAGAGRRTVGGADGSGHAPTRGGYRRP